MEKRTRTRKTKVEAGEEKKIKAKYLEEREEYIQAHPVRPLNSKQKQYLDDINNQDAKQLILCTGFPGTSKTYLATVVACDKYRVGSINKIYLVRPFVSKSKSPGYYAGTLEEKASIWLGEIVAVMRERLGSAALKIAIENNDIEFIPLEVIKGRSLKNCFVIVDEAEDITKEEARKIVTRMGSNCKMILAGDIGQCDLGGESGLKFLISLAENHPELEKTVSIIDFNQPSDIVRSDVCKLWTMAFYREGVGNYDRS